MVNVRLFERFKLTIADLFVCHEDVIADFHKAPTVAVWVTMLAKLGVVRNIKLVEHLTVGATRIADRRVLGCTIATPPVFATVVVEDAFALFDTTGVPFSFAADISLTIAQLFSRK